MAGWVHMKVTLIKGGMAKYGIKNPIFKPSPIKPVYNDYLIFEGISVDEKGKQLYLDVNVAYRQACLNAIEYLKKFGYSGAQAYSILGTAPVQGHISGVVDVHNACATLWLPTEIFDFDINPTAAGPIKMHSQLQLQFQFQFQLQLQSLLALQLKLLFSKTEVFVIFLMCLYSN